MNFGKIMVFLSNVRVAGAPTFMPSANGDPKRHHTMVTVICNRGKNSTTGEEMSDEITLNFWNKRALFAAKYLGVGREINVIGELRSYRHQTGQINPTTGKAIIHRRVEVLVTNCLFGKDSMKELSARINNNLALLKQAGRVPANVVLTAEELLKVNRIDPGDYNPAIHDASGAYGVAKIWKKGAGFTTAPTQTAAPAATVTPEQVQALQAAVAGAGTTETNPFVG